MNSCVICARYNSDSRRLSAFAPSEAPPPTAVTRPLFPIPKDFNVILFASVSERVLTNKYFITFLKILQYFFKNPLTFLSI